MATADIAVGDLEPGKFYTVAAMGLLREADGAMPAICGAALDTACPDALAARIQLLADTGAPAAGKVSIRIVQGIPNMPNLDICVDGSAVGDAGTPGPAGSPTLIASDVAQTAASAYLDMDPIADGFITIHAHQAAGDCVGAAMLAAVAVPFPDPIGVIPGTTKTFDADTIVTIFASGRNMATPPDPDPAAPAFAPWYDQDTAPAAP
jgi:hypothetical protein